jgi:hypothetical protein
LGEGFSVAENRDGMVNKSPCLQGESRGFIFGKAFTSLK